MATPAPPTRWLTSDGVGGSGDRAHDGHQPLPVKRRNEVLESELVSLSIVASHHMAWGDHMEQCHGAMRVSMRQCMCMCMCRDLPTRKGRFTMVSTGLSCLATVGARACTSLSISCRCDGIFLASRLGGTGGGGGGVGGGGPGWVYGALVLPMGQDLM